MISNRGYAINMLKYYQQAGLSASVTAIVDYLDSQDPNFLDSWGSAARGMPVDPLKNALEKLAKSKGMRLPTKADLNTALVEAGSNIPNLANAVKAGLQDSAAQAGKAFLFGLSGATMILVLGGVGFLLWKSGALKSVAKK